MDTIYELAGGTSIYAKHLLQRQFRDLHAITQRVMVSATSTALAGPILPDAPTAQSLL